MIYLQTDFIYNTIKLLKTEEIMVNKLIINADDYGLCDGASLGILKAHHDGVLTSTTCMMNMPEIEKYLKIAEKYPDLGLGVHLNITVGPALTKNSFTDDQGIFRPRSAYPDCHPQVNQEELYAEWKAQIERFIALTGHKPTHLDSHHHVHLLPEYQSIALKLAREYDLPLRQESYLQTDFEYVRFTEVFYNETVSLQTIQDICHYPDDIFEMMCHPAFVDDYLFHHSAYHIKRTEELALLCDQQTKEMMTSLELIHYGQIKKIK